MPHRQSKVHVYSILILKGIQSAQQTGVLDEDEINDPID